MTKVSVIVPVYNVEGYLEKCLESLVRQSLKDIEIIVVNDGATDNSLKIAKKYEEKYSNILKVYSKRNGGLSDARNFGLIYATGEYIAFLDSDDLLALHCIESCMQIVEREKDIDLVWHDFYSIDENGKKIGENIQFRDKHIISDSNYIFVDYSTIFHLKLQTTNGFAWGGLISLQVINSRRLRFMDSVYAEDQAFAFMLFAIVNRIVLMTQSLYGYRHRIGSTENFNPQVHTYPKFKSDIYQSFKNKILAKEYDISHSWLIMANTLYDFKDTLQNQEKQHLVFAACLYCTPHRVKALYTIAIEKKDPKAAIKLFTRLYTILPKNHFKIPTKIAYYMPSAYRIFYIFKNILNTLRKK